MQVLQKLKQSKAKEKKKALVVKEVIILCIISYTQDTSTYTYGIKTKHTRCTSDPSLPS